MDSHSASSGQDQRRLASRLRFRHLQLLVALRDHGSLHAAAEALSLTQPSLSKMLKEIELSFGRPLFERSARGVAPTPAGAVVLHGAALLLDELERLGREASAEPPAMLLRLGAPPFLALTVVPQLLLRLTELAPTLQITLPESGVPALLRALIDGQLDAVLATYTPDIAASEARKLAFEKLHEASYLVVVAQQHPLARQRRIGWDVLAREPWVLPPEGVLLRRVIDDAFARAGLAPPVARVTSANPLTNLQLAAAGLGVSAVPKAALALSTDAQRVACLDIRHRLPSGSVGLLYRASHVHPRLDLLRAALAKCDFPT
ncbi:MAG: LysR substrate-binding domain-containing protein [Burkholderiaceae bacterium]|nr:LysR substrate-binding domain-containing protein [Ottowia sp.]